MISGQETLQGAGHGAINIREILLVCLLAICIFFPGDPYGAKVPVFLLLVLVSLDSIASILQERKYRFVLVMGLIYPVIISCESIILTGDVRSALAGSWPALLLVISVVSIQHDLRYQHLVHILLKILTLMTILLVALDWLGLNDINANTVIRRAIYDLDMGMVGKSDAYAVYYKAYFKASPLILLLLYRSLTKQDAIWSTLSFVALFLSGARASLLAAVVLAVAWLFVKRDQGKYSHAQLMAIFVLATVGLAGFTLIKDAVQAMFLSSGSQASDMTRHLEYQGYLEMWSNPKNLILGTGFGSSFFNYGRGIESAGAELSYLEMIRHVGILFSVPFFVALCTPLSTRIPILLKVAYLLYLAIAYTNPLLFSSTALVAYNYVLVEYFQIHNSICENALPDAS